jgi:NTP pyrophosphatase (non-canonical NTP hydrolase)
MERGLICVSNKVNEILDILQEECGEVIVAISKIRRFGIDNSYKDGGTQREHLVQELGDVTLLIELLHAHQLYTQTELHEAQVRKAQKLNKWSKIYED